MTARTDRQRNYNLLARAVACERCGTKAGEPCRGAGYGGHIVGTHYKWRQFATKVRREKLA